MLPRRFGRFPCQAVKAVLVTASRQGTSAAVGTGNEVSMASPAQVTTIAQPPVPTGATGAASEKASDGTTRTDAPPSSQPVASGAFSYKGLKVKKRGPWGQNQLRDSWTNDAMSYRDTESIGNRVASKNRYHPDFYTRRYFVLGGLSLVAGVFLTMFMACRNYGIERGQSAGDAFWNAMKRFRTNDISPRSARKPDRLLMDTPAHLQAYRNHKTALQQAAQSAEPKET